MSNPFWRRSKRVPFTNAVPDDVDPVFRDLRDFLTLPSLPTEPGLYWDNLGEPWMLTVDGHFYDKLGETRPLYMNELLLTIDLVRADF